MLPVPPSHPSSFKPQTPTLQHHDIDDSDIHQVHLLEQASHTLHTEHTHSILPTNNPPFSADETCSVPRTNTPLIQTVPPLTVSQTHIPAQPQPRPQQHFRQAPPSLKEGQINDILTGPDLPATNEN